MPRGTVTYILGRGQKHGKLSRYFLILYNHEKLLKNIHSEMSIELNLTGNNALEYEHKPKLVVMKKKHLKVTVQDAGTMHVKPSLYHALVSVAEENAKLTPAEYVAQIRADIAEHEATGKSLFVE